MYVEIEQSLTEVLESAQSIAGLVSAGHGVEQIWTPNIAAGGESDEAALERIARFIVDVWYDNSMRGPETKRCLGLLVVSEALGQEFKTLNQAKARFKDQITSFSQTQAGKERIAKWSQEGPGEIHVRSLLTTMSAPRLNLLQAYRQWVILDQRVRRAGFTWAKKNKSSIKLSAEELIDLAQQKISDPDSQAAAIDRISRSREQAFQVERAVATHAKCNIAFESGVRAGVMAHSPLILSAQVQLPKISFKFPDEQLNYAQRETARITGYDIPELRARAIRRA